MRKFHNTFIVVLLFSFLILGIQLIIAEILPVICEVMNDYVTDYGLTEFYAQTSWPTLHRDSRNSDFTPFVAPVELAEKWTALDSVAVLGPVTIGPEGNLYVTTGKSNGYSNLHAFDRNGNPLWDSSALDSWAVSSSAIVDCGGDVYISDRDQFWSFHRDGSVKWVVPIPASFATSAFFTADGYVGGITTNGEVLILDRDVGSLSVPILSLPDGTALPALTTPPGLWEDMIDPQIIDDLYAFSLGYKFEVTNTPAVNPLNNRIYIAAAGPTPLQGVFYGIDYMSGGLSIAFQTPMGPGKGASPAISPDGMRVYASDGNGNLYAFDAYTGAMGWMLPVKGEPIASTSIGPDGTIYMLGGGSLMYAIVDQGNYAKLLWSKNFDSMASQHLPPIPNPYPGPYPEPILYPTAVINSAILTAANYLYVAANLGYEIFLPIYKKYFFVPKMTVMAIVDPITGSFAAPTMDLRDTCDGVISMGSDGSIYIPHGAIASSVAHFLNPFLPPDLKVTPIGGISALEPVSFLDLIESGICWVQELDATALSYLDSESIDEAYTQMRHGVVQLGATFSSISDAEVAEIDSQSAQQARQRVQTAQTLLNNAKEHIAQARIKPNKGLLNSAKQLIENAEKELEQALSILEGPAAPWISEGLNQILPDKTLQFRLEQNYPNPFNPDTWIPFSLSNPEHVVIKIFDSAGKLVRKLDLGNKEAGTYISRAKSAYWNGRNEAGEQVASGIYFYTIQAGTFTATKKMIIQR